MVDRKTRDMQRQTDGQMPIWSGCSAYFGRVVYRCGHWSGKPQHDDFAHPGLCWSCRQQLIGQEITFLRRGKAPASGVSVNHATGQAEPGVSVYLVLDGHVADVDRFQDRPAYTGTGVVVGFGSDGEPCVRVSKIRRNKEMD